MTSGIYMILNSVSNKVYVGQTSDVNLRFIRHKSKLKNNTHANPRLQASYNKHGISAFSYEVLEFCDKDKNMLTLAEQYWMDYFNFIGVPLYNIAPIAESRLGMKHSKEANERKSLRQLGKKHKPHTEETKIKCGAKNIGRKLTEEQKQKLISSRLGKPLSEETKNKISASNKGKLLSDSHKQALKDAWMVRRAKLMESN